MSNRSKYTSSTTGILFALVATAIVVYHMASVVSLIQGPLEHQIVHLGMMFLVVFGAALLSRPGLAGNIAWSLCLIVGLGVIVYMRVNYEYLLDVVGFPENPDMVVGVLLVIVVLVGTWMSWGNVFPGLAVIMIVYFFWGHHLPDPLYHPKIDFDLGISNLGIGFSGVFGSLLSVMANFGFNLVIFGALLGRLLCGWVCPFGFLQDLLHKIPSPKFTAPDWTANIKYVVLIVSVFLLPFMLGEGTVWSYCRFCPVAAIQVTLPWAAKNGVALFQWYHWVKIGLMVVILVTVVFSSRIFCRALCPIGALMAVFNYVSFWRVKPPTQACISCRKCDKNCPTGVHPSERIQNGLPPSHNLDCVLCHECSSVCPVKGKLAEDDSAPPQTEPAA